MVAPFPRLSPRLLAVAEAIAPGRRVADLGTDHGILPLWLAANGLVEHCVATEKTTAVLADVVRAPRGAAWAELLSYRAGDGMGALRPADRIDTIVIAGMGGKTIVRLLGADRRPVPELSRIVLQPRSEPELVRRWLSENGWRPVRERLTEVRGRLHLTLAAEPGDDGDLYRHACLGRADLLAAGPLLVRSPVPELGRYWRRERDRLTAIPGPAVSGAPADRLRAAIARSERILRAISTPCE